MQNLKPLGDRVVIEPSPKEKQTKSGIVIPDTAEGKPMEGKIIAIGPGRLNEKGERVPMSVKVGDIVLFKKYEEANPLKTWQKESAMIRQQKQAEILAH